ncbi:MAG: trypsin-like peptidase domain-containing protein [Akkermansiaceae bacterium]|nr:trypsin-like peptidase domain-containing protein [Akkermansiaceae bacterium]
MFADAYDIAREFTRPVVISTRTWDGEVRSSLAAFVVLNEFGWFATAAHVLNAFFAARQHAEEIAMHSEHRQADPNPKWITNQSFWWGWDGINLAEVHVRGESDLAIGRLEPFEPGVVKEYPTVIDEGHLRPGTSLLRLGYPFHSMQATFAGGQFQLPKGALPAPLFPIEGIFTRQIRVEGSIIPRFIETTSPGLLGQSGGPVVDIDGMLWGIQSRTHHLNLGFSPRVQKDGEVVEEHQFLNVGIAVHPNEIIDLCVEKGVKLARG